MSSESEVPAPASAAASESSPTSTSSAEETKTVATTATSSATSSSTADLEAEVATLRKKLATSESVLQENKKDIAALKKSLALTQSFVESSSVRTNLVVDVPTQHTSWIRAIAQSPSSQWLVSGGGDGSLQVGIRAECESRNVFLLCEIPVLILHLPSLSRYILSHQFTQIWDLQSHQSVAFIKRAASQWIRSLCFHPTEDIFLVVSSDTEVQLWARKDGESKTTAKTSSSSSSSSSSSAPSSATSTGKKSSSSSSSSSSSGKNDTGGWSKIGSVYTSVGGHDITWSPDGTKFVIGTFGSGALVYEARFNEDFTNWNPRLQHTLSHPGASDIFAVAWNPSGTFIATGNKNRETTIWDAESGMHLCQLSKMPSEVCNYVTIYGICPIPYRTMLFCFHDIDIQ